MTDEQVEWGKKMIKLSIHFWTNDLPRNSDLKTAWESGAIHIVANRKRGLEHDYLFFKDLTDLMPKLGLLLKRNGVKLKKIPIKAENIDLDRLSQYKHYAA